jgi:hypothetical protein
MQNNKFSPDSFFFKKLFTKKFRSHISSFAENMVKSVNVTLQEKKKQLQRFIQ